MTDSTPTTTALPCPNCGALVTWEQSHACLATAALPNVPPVGRAAGDHVLALHALNVLRAELGGMTYNTIDGVHNNLQVCAQSLDMVESLIKHHAEMRYRGMEP